MMPMPKWDERLAGADWAGADNYGLLSAPEIHDLAALRAFVAWYLGGDATLTIYGSRVTGQMVADSDLDVASWGCDAAAAGRLLAAFYPGLRIDCVRSTTVWVPDYAPYQPLNLGPMPAQIRTLGVDVASTAIRAAVDGHTGPARVAVPSAEGSSEEPGCHHVRRALVYAQSRGWTVDMRVGVGSEVVIDRSSRSMRLTYTSIAPPSRPYWAGPGWVEGDSRGPYLGTRG